MSYEIEFYRLPSGREPVREFLEKLNRQNQLLMSRVIHDIDLLQEAAHAFREPDVKYMGRGIYELRSRAGSNITRVFYFFFRGKRIILTNGFVKKTQKTPPMELEKAHRYKKDYEENHDQLR
ncbi:MAG: type II toxin-antitoxin system RelE/ParE family toxin [Planctomycetia bacterium]|nr:type II toxin-antitoxin system RelE/ParE family toxin [Planctomycetia bacterium]